jgi:cell division control protein 24
MDAMRRVADKVNETQRKHENFQMVMELKQRVDHWKGISIDKCGQLLLQDKLLVVVYGNEMETHVFFFENHLLLCKDTTHKTRLAKSATISIKKQQRHQQRRANTLEPKGMIATSMIVALHDASAEGKPQRFSTDDRITCHTIHGLLTFSLSLSLYLSIFITVM